MQLFFSLRNKILSYVNVGEGCLYLAEEMAGLRREKSMFGERNRKRDGTREETDLAAALRCG